MSSKRRRRTHDLVVVANRLPVRMVRSGSSRSWVTSPGGLVSALFPVLSEHGGAAWVGWTGSTEAPPDPFDHDGIRLVPVPLSRLDVELYYEGFANGTLWPLYHDAVATPDYHRTWWEAYASVNRRFASSIATVAARGATVWVHDYQLQLVPAYLRELRPDLTIGFFDHIPFPPSELFVRLPWRRQVLDGLLGADLIGFQTPLGVHNFLRVVQELGGIKARKGQLEYDGRTIRAAAYPVGIDAETIVALARSPETARRATELREALGNPHTLLLGVDRLDYTKGIEARLRAYRELLGEGRITVDECVMMQIAEPSRSNVLGYAEIRSDVEQLVGDINGNFSEMGRPAVHYLHQSQPIEELVAMYSIADVMLVTPIRDGMNLVAKEYVAARVDGGGSLVLSEFAGAAVQLPTALLVNPHDIAGLKNAIDAAVHLEESEARRRMKVMRRSVLRDDAQRWARRFLEDLGVTW